jgi:NTE family protein/lysophospholipid hydrolase
MEKPTRGSSNADLVKHIRSADPFKNLNKKVFQDLSVHLNRIALPNGETLFRQGDPTDALYVVISGCLQSALTREDGSVVPLGKINPGQPVGEMQLLAGGTRTATVYALCDSELVKLPQEGFTQLAAKAPELIQHMGETIRRRLRRDQLTLILPSLLGPLDETMIEDIEAHLEWVHLKRGDGLFRQGDTGDSLYLVISGRLQAVSVDRNGTERVLNEVARGESVGEMAMFTGEPRASTISAIRDSELVKFSKPAFERIIAQYPQLNLHITRTLINRLRKTIASPSFASTVRNIAVVPHGPEVPLQDFTNRLVSALDPVASTLHLSSERLDKLLGSPGIAQVPEDHPHRVRLASWLDEQETRYRYLIYETDMTPSPWTERCIRQADQILLVAQARANPAPGQIEAALLHQGSALTSTRRTLVLIHPDGSALPSGTSRWLAGRSVERHYHLRWERDADFTRLARLLSGRAIGVVLGGGGARGFSHIGVIRAFKEAGVPIDMVGGTSIGSIIAAQYALGWDHETMLRMNKRAWIEMKPLNDYTFPVISLFRSKKFDDSLKWMYGDTDIEDLWINYFCVSSNLSAAEMVVHTKGRLWRAIRASASLPGVAVPVVDRGNLLVDGGVLNNLPGDVMRSVCGGLVIAVNVSPDKDVKVGDAILEMPSSWDIIRSRVMPHREPLHTPTILDILMRTTMLSSVHKAGEIQRDADLYLRPPVGDFGLLEVTAMDQIVRVGYKYAKTKIEEWKQQQIGEKRLHT